MFQLDKNNIADIYALSSMQMHLLFHYMSNDDNAYSVVLRLDCNGEIDIAQFVKAWNKVISDNEMLRTIFRWEEIKTPCQIVLKNSLLNFENLDFSAYRQEEFEKSINELTKKERAIRFDLAKEPPFKIILCKGNSSNYTILIKNHHIIYDGWSNGIIIKEFFDNYTKLVENQIVSTNIKTSYKSYIKYSMSKDVTKHKLFWKKYLFDSTSIVDFSTKVDVRHDETNISIDKIRLPKEISLLLDSTAKENKLSISTLYYSAWALLLAYYSSLSDIIFGTVVSGRNIAVKGLENSVGLFINTVPLRIDLSKHADLNSILQKINSDLIKRKEHEIYELQEIKRLSGAKKEDLFKSSVTIENYPVDKKLFNTRNKLYIEKYSIEESVNFDLSLNIELFDLEEVTIALKYNANKFTKKYVANISEHFINILTQIPSSLDKSINEIDLLTALEKKALLNLSNSKSNEIPINTTYDELFESKAKRYCDKVALVSDNHSLTFGELNERSNRLAKELTSKGAKEGEVIAIYSFRSVNFFVGILGIMKAGCAYLPIDYELPEERINFLLKHSNVNKLVVEKSKLSSVITFTKEVVFSDISYENNTERSTKLKTNVANRLAYVIYTSGTTGVPKGVGVEHRQLINNTYAIWDRINIEKHSRVANISSFATDLGNTTIFPSLLNGCQLYIIPKALFVNSVKLDEYFCKNNIDFIKLTPTHLEALIDDGAVNIIPKKLIMLAGELLNRRLVERIRQIRPKCRIINSYGPTETTINVICYEVPFDNETHDSLHNIPLGFLLNNSSVYVLNKYKQLLPVNTVGELYISGQSVARGYINNLTETSKSFCKLPFGSDELVYRTGDFGMLTEDGAYHFVGRKDNQVKINGFRIELDEIKCYLQQNSKVEGAVVVAKYNEDRRVFICAYYVSKIEIDPNEFREYLSKYLPNYMIPSNYVRINEIPLSANGKLNFKALPNEKIKFEHKFELPRNETEAILLQVWKDVLKVKSISIHDDYFNMNGDSIKFIQISSRLMKKGYLIDIQDVYDYPTVALLSLKLKKSTVKSNSNGKLDGIGNSTNQTRLSLNDATYKDIGVDYIQELRSKYNFKDVYRLSPMQSGMLHHSLKDKDENLYFEQVSYSWHGNFNIDSFNRSLKLIVKRHDVLRTIFLNPNITEWIQVVLEESSIDFNFTDLTNKLNQDEVIKKIKEQDKIEGFNLSISPLVRVLVLKLDKDAYELIWSSHHILMDGWSKGVILSELFESYTSYLKNIEPKLPQVTPYVNFISWLENQNYEVMLSYWKNYLHSFDTPTGIPRLNIKSEPRKIAVEKLFISSEDTTKLRNLSIKYKVTFNSIVKTIWSILLAKYNDKTDVVFGSIESGRPSEIEGIEDMIGLFINNIPVRLQFDMDNTISYLFKKTQRLAIESIIHQYVSLGRIQNQSELKQNLLDHILVFKNYPLYELNNISDFSQNKLSSKQDISIKENSAIGQINYDLIVEVCGVDEMQVNFKYKSTFDKNQIIRLKEHFYNIIKQIVIDESISVGDIDILSKAEKDKILYSFNSKKQILYKSNTIHELFESRVELVPDQIAVEYKGKQITYKELNIRANVLANYLRNRGVLPDTIIGLMVNKTIEMVVSILGILKAGGAYLPIDPNYPIERQKYIIKDSGLQLLITDKLQNGISDLISNIIVLDENILKTGNSKSKKNLYNISCSDNLAYVIYTSGTTGKPKGAMIEHRNLLSLIEGTRNKFQFDKRDIWTMFHSYCFDFSVWELFGALFNKAKLILVPKEYGFELPKYIDLLISRNVTILNSTPVVFYNIAKYEKDFSIPKLIMKYIIFGGEALNPKKIKEWNQRYPATQLINMYGITETTIHASFKEITKIDLQSELSNIGSPLPSLGIYIVDSMNGLCPVGVSGEILVAGEGVCRGYLNRKNLTNEKFENKLYQYDRKAYRSGDLARWLPNGEIEYLGRIDNQVKLRGYRIELKEIEYRLSEHKEIKEAIVLLQKINDEDHLCAYYTSLNEQYTEELRSYLIEKLPSYMIPSYFTLIHEIPLTVNGKIDKKSLSSLEITMSKREDKQLSSTEKKLTEIWSQTLKIEADNIAANFDFFVIGGHSLLVTQVLNSVMKEFGVTVTIMEFFDNSTIRLISAVIEAKLLDRNTEETIVNIEPLKLSKDYLASPAQKRIFHQQSMDENDISYNVPVIMKLEGSIDQKRIENVLNMLIERHESLRTIFFFKNNELIQEVQEKSRLKLESTKIMDENIELFHREFVQPFSLSTGPLVRAKLLYYKQDLAFLFLDFHHISIDLYSSQILLTEFIQLYNEDVNLPKIKLQYKDYSESFYNINKQSLDNEKEYWENIFKKELPYFQFPTDFNKPLLRDQSKGDLIIYKFDKEISEKLDAAIHTTKTTKFIYLFAVYNILLNKYTGDDDIVVGTTIAGRNHPELKNVVGMFINMLPLRNNIYLDETFFELLKRIRKNTLNSFENQKYPFDELVIYLRKKGILKNRELFTTEFAYNNIPLEESIQCEDLKITRINTNSKFAKFDLHFQLLETNNNLEIALRYSTELFRKSTVQKILEHYIDILNCVLTDGKTLIREIVLSHNLDKSTSEMVEHLDDWDIS